jgi:hypothetical protein
VKLSCFLPPSSGASEHNNVAGAGKNYFGEQVSVRVRPRESSKSGWVNDLRKFLTIMERVGKVLSIIPKIIRGLIMGVFGIWFNILLWGSVMAAPYILFHWDTKGGLFKSIADWAGWLCFGWMR